MPENQVGVAEKKPKVKFFATRRAKQLEKEKEQKLLGHSRTYRTVQYLVKKTNFDAEQVNSLMDMYKCLAAATKMNRHGFRQLLHKTFRMNNAIMIDRIFATFDGDSQGTVSETEWVMGLSAMLRGSFDEQVNFTFEVYDMNGDNSIRREEVHSYLRGCFRPVASVPNEDEEDFKAFESEIVDLAMRKLDVDHDGVIAYGDFHDAVSVDPLLLQSLGPCLPSLKATRTFLALLDMNYHNFFNGLSVPGDIGWDNCRDKSTRVGVENKNSKLRLHKVVSVFDRSSSKSKKSQAE